MFIFFQSHCFYYTINGIKYIIIYNHGEIVKVIYFPIYCFLKNKEIDIVSTDMLWFRKVFNLLKNINIVLNVGNGTFAQNRKW